jgi:hypothetical protein
LKVSKSRSPNKKMENSNDSEFCYWLFIYPHSYKWAYGKSSRTWLGSCQVAASDCHAFFVICHK